MVCRKLSCVECRCFENRFEPRVAIRVEAARLGRVPSSRRRAASRPTTSSLPPSRSSSRIPLVPKPVGVQDNRLDVRRPNRTDSRDRDQPIDRRLRPRLLEQTLLRSILKRHQHGELLIQQRRQLAVHRRQLRKPLLPMRRICHLRRRRRDPSTAEDRPGPIDVRHGGRSPTARISVVEPRNFAGVELHQGQLRRSYMAHHRVQPERRDARWRHIARGGRRVWSSGSGWQCDGVGARLGRVAQFWSLQRLRRPVAEF